MVTALDLPQDLVEHLQQRAAQEGRGINETAAELLRAGLAASLHATAINVDALEAPLTADLKRWQLALLSHGIDGLIGDFQKLSYIRER